MVVLLAGATGFIGRHLLPALMDAGHEVRCLVRRPGRFAHVSEVQGDLAHEHRAADWIPRLDGVDVLINAVGILREQPNQRFEDVHVRGAQALFSAAASAGVRRVIQFSALGADEGAQSAYHRTKKQADDFLRSLPLDSVIVQPSLVFGTDGASSRLFGTLASLPLIVLPGAGEQAIQPVHVDDLVALVLRLLAAPLPPGTRIAAVGPRPLSLRAYLAAVRAGMGLGRARFFSVPPVMVRCGTRFLQRLPGNLWDVESLAMLERGNTADPAPMQALLGRPARPVERFFGPEQARSLRIEARLAWLLPLLRWSVALVWIVTGIVSLGVYPAADSYALLARAGVPPALAPLSLYGAAVLDIALGLAILSLPGRRWLWAVQALLIVSYTVIITLRLPEYWLHPYGPILKNLPLLAAIWLLYEFEDERGRRRWITRP